MHVDEKVWQKFPGLSVAVALIEGIRVKPSMDVMVTLPYSLEELEELEEYKALKSFMWKTGISSQESIKKLAERVLEEGKLQMKNVVVDLCNLTSLKYLIPIVAIDLDKARDGLVFKIAEKGENFNKKKLSGKELVAADIEKILCIFPNQVNEKAEVDTNTKRCLLIGLGVPGVEKEYVVECVEELYKNIVNKCGGHYKGLVVLAR